MALFSLPIFLPAFPRPRRFWPFRDFPHQQGDATSKGQTAKAIKGDIVFYAQVGNKEAGWESYYYTSHSLTSYIIQYKWSYKEWPSLFVFFANKLLIEWWPTCFPSVLDYSYFKSNFYQIEKEREMLPSNVRTDTRISFLFSIELFSSLFLDLLRNWKTKSVEVCLALFRQDHAYWLVIRTDLSLWGYSKLVTCFVVLKQKDSNFRKHHVIASRQQW